VTRSAPGQHWLDRSAGRRTFIAVPLGADARDAVARLMTGLGYGTRRQGGGPPPRWVRPESLHLTMRFLGVTRDQDLRALRDCVDEAAAGADAIDCRLAGAGAFPAGDRPRILWLGVGEGADALAALAVRVEDALAGRGWPRDDRPFNPHLTIARTDGVVGALALAREMEEGSAGLDARWRTDRLVLFESITGQGPARYEPLHEARLRDAESAPAG